MTCHFVYAVPPPQKPLARVRRLAMLRLQKMGMAVSAIGNRQAPATGSWPVRSPFENTRNVFERLSKKSETLLYDIYENSPGKVEPGDVLVGHPYFPARPDTKGQTELLMEKHDCWKRIGVISPVHCDPSFQTSHINRDYLLAIDKLIPRADVFFAVMGPYWEDQWKTSDFAHWLPKLVRLDMAIDVGRFPRVKKRFNPPGKRGFFFIGKNDPMKGVDFLADIFTNLGNCPKGRIGPGPDVPGVPRISLARALTPEYMSEIAGKYDFFISPSRADPNPTTILESMAWGFPVVCTPQSGYYESEYRMNIHRDDLKSTLETLNALQYMDENRLMAMSDMGRQTVEQDYTWDRFAETIIKHMEMDR
ncbi:MAG: glycosyltransferase [Candidatus Sumerlaeia bacterium]